MIKISRTTDVNDIAEMVPHFVVETQKQRRELVQQITQGLLNQQGALLVVQAKRDGKLVGFVVAHDAGEFVWLAQAWVEEGTSWSVADALWSHILMWSVALGKVEIRAESKRDIGALHRRFGFEEHTKIISRKLELGLMSQLARSLTDGRNIQPPGREQSECGVGIAGPSGDFSG